MELDLFEAVTPRIAVLPEEAAVADLVSVEAAIVEELDDPLERCFLLRAPPIVEAVAGLKDEVFDGSQAVAHSAKYLRVVPFTVDLNETDDRVRKDDVL